MMQAAVLIPPVDNDEAVDSAVTGVGLAEPVAAVPVPAAASGAPAVLELYAVDVPAYVKR